MWPTREGTRSARPQGISWIQQCVSERTHSVASLTDLQELVFTSSIDGLLTSQFDILLLK